MMKSVLKFSKNCPQTMKMHIAISDWVQSKVRLFSREFNIGADIEYELTQSGDFNKDTMSILWSPMPITIESEE